MKAKGNRQSPCASHCRRFAKQVSARASPCYEIYEILLKCDRCAGSPCSQTDGRKCKDWQSYIEALQQQAGNNMTNTIKIYQILLVSLDGRWAETKWGFAGHWMNWAWQVETPELRSRLTGRSGIWYGQDSDLSPKMAHAVAELFRSSQSNTFKHW